MNFICQREKHNGRLPVKVEAHRGWLLYVAKHKSTVIRCVIIARCYASVCVSVRPSQVGSFVTQATPHGVILINASAYAYHRMYGPYRRSLSAVSVRQIDVKEIMFMYASWGRGLLSSPVARLALCGLPDAMQTLGGVSYLKL